MTLAKTLAKRGLVWFATLIVIIIVVSVIISFTGFAEKMIQSTINEQLRSEMQQKAREIKDPEELKKFREKRKQELLEFYKIDKKWIIDIGFTIPLINLQKIDMTWALRIPPTIANMLLFRLGEARVLKSSDGSSRIQDILAERMVNTLGMILPSIAIVATVSIFAGAVLATKVGKKIDRTIAFFAAISNSTPSWWMAIMLIYVFSISLKIFPSSGMYSAPPPSDALGRFLDFLWHLILPIATLVIVTIGTSIYSTRSLLVNISQEDFVNAARIKGVSESEIRRRYVLRVAAPAIVTGIVLSLAASIGGAILTETVFNWPGMGRLYYDAIFAVDEAVIIALAYIFAFIYLIARFVLEILYVILDPRVRT